MSPNQAISARYFTGPEQDALEAQTWPIPTPTPAGPRSWPTSTASLAMPGSARWRSSTLFRARRLVGDTGLHTKGWTRQQAIDYWIEWIEASEIQRYVVNHGQACACMIGQLKLVELRHKARTALGARFDAKAFHNAVLGMGTAPLTMIEEQVDRCIAALR
jgi:hypothetical protein